MSEDWSKLRDIDPLADGRARIDFAIPIAEFPRLRPQLARAEGIVTGHARFDRERGLPVADVQVEGRLALTCQRCLEPFDHPVQSSGRVALVASAAEADRASADLETILAPDRRITLRDLVEEELLLLLPIVPRHAGEACAEATAAAPGAEARAGAQPRDADLREPGEEADRHRPFERLNELLKRHQ
jgi:uncharacterized protein